LDPRKKEKLSSELYDLEKWLHFCENQAIHEEQKLGKRTIEETDFEHTQPGYKRQRT